MGRPRKWESDAERMRAKRRGLSLEQYAEPAGNSAENSATSQQPDVDELEHVHAMQEADLEAGIIGSESPSLSEPPVFSEQAYVDMEVLATKLQIKAGLQDHDGKRVHRARKYARWRYRSFKAGETASL